jgi:hypothetical protein
MDVLYIELRYNASKRPADFDLDELFGAASGLQPRKEKSGADQKAKVSTFPW